MENQPLETEEKLKLMTDQKNVILDYMKEQKKINEAALKAYDPDVMDKHDADIRKMREIEAIKLRDRVYELSRHIDVIERM